MALTFGIVKGKIVSNPKLQSSRHKDEIQYHLHATVAFPRDGSSIDQWDTTISVARSAHA
jgi:hypothetical protein